MKKNIILVLLILVVGIVWLAGSFWSGNGQLSKSLVVQSGQGVKAISQELYQQGAIKNKLVFETLVWLKHAGNKLKAGVYTLPANASANQVLNILLLGPQSNESSITFVEGWSRQSAQFKAALTSHGFDYQKFLSLTDSKKDWQDKYSFLADAPTKASLEGYLFPNTHFIDDSTTEKELIARILNDFDRQLSPELRAAIKKQNKTIFEVITLASIVEREVPKSADKKMIADIFIKRLQQGIGLQSDATINFITGKGLTQPTAEDVKINSPYNTYKYKGLPPGPIGNSGLESIKAVIYPTANPYYYFLTTKDGTVIYSKTYNEHLANKKKYLN